MKCPTCQSELIEGANYCSECGYNLRSEEDVQASSNDSQSSAGRGSSDAEDALKLPSGFRRTLSTDLVERQTELRTLRELNTLVESRTWEPGEVIIHKGDTSRDLFFLTEGVVEISTQKDDGNFVLAEIEPPFIIGDIAFLSGFQRTATAKAKTQTKMFLLKYEHLRNLFKELPEWLHPLLTSLVSGVKSLHYQIAELKKEVSGSRRNPG
jgi:CRP-like cAMP-binding protein